MYLASQPQGECNLLAMASRLGGEGFCIGDMEIIANAGLAMVPKLYLNPGEFNYTRQYILDRFRNSDLHVISLDAWPESIIEPGQYVHQLRNEMGYRLRDAGRVHVARSRGDIDVINAARRGIGYLIQFIENSKIEDY